MSDPDAFVEKKEAHSKILNAINEKIYKDSNNAVISHFQETYKTLCDVPHAMLKNYCLALVPEYGDIERNFQNYKNQEDLEIKQCIWETKSFYSVVFDSLS